MRKRWIFSIVTLLLVSVLVATALTTWASYSDTETSTGNLATGWHSSVHWATTQTDFQTGEQYFVDSSTSSGDVLLQTTNYLFACQGGGSNAVYRYNETKLDWESIASVPGSGVGAGGGLSYPGTGNYVYCLKGNNTNEFYCYDIATDSWSAMAVVPVTVTTGGYLRAAQISTSYYLYAFTGGSGFYRYDIGAGTWSAALASPGTTGAGASMTWDRSNTLYATLGGGTTTFLSYNISSGNTWTTLTGNPVPSAVGAGGELSYSNTGTAYIFATQGDNNIGFYRYNIGTPGWSTVASTPAAVTTGGSLRWDDGGFLFAFQGGSTTFWRYNISLNTWTVTLAPVTYSVIGGGACISDNSRYNYAFTGGASNYFLRYDTNVVGGDTWTTLTSPGSTGLGAFLVYCENVTPSGKTPGDYIFAFPGGTSSAFWVYSVSGGTWTTTLTSAGIGSDDGASLEWTGGDYIYAFFGKTKNFKRYTISTNSWTNMKNANRIINNGASLAWDHSTYIYAINGSSTSFERYSINADTWTSLANLPGIVNTGGGLNYPTNSAGGNALYAVRGAATLAFYKYLISSNTWSVMDNVPSTVSAGGSLCNISNGYVYCIPGNSTTNHWRYNVAYNTWAEILPLVPGATGAGARIGGHLTGYITSGYMTSEVIDNSGICEGGALTYDGTYLYGTAGDLSTSMRKYDISGNSWDLLASLKDKAGWGAALCSDKSTYIYAFVGNNKNTFFRYNTSSNTWSALAPAPGNIYAGGALVYVSTGTGYIYAYQGGTTAFWKYDVAGNSWSVLAVTSVSTGAGASLAYDGTDIYGTLGGGSNVFRRYSISDTTWENIATVPANVGTGGGLAYPGAGSFIYCLVGNDTSDLYRYDTSANSWSQLSSTQTSVFQGGCLIAGDSDHLYTYRGRDTVTFWRFTISTDLWEAMTDTPVAAYIRMDALVWDRTLPSGTNITYSIRSSNSLFSLTDASPSWTLLTAAEVNAGSSSAVLSGLGYDRYVQFKVIFTTAYINGTPLLSERRIYYYRWY